MKRWALVVLLVPLMALFGIGVYNALGSLKTKPPGAAKPVIRSRTLVPVSGTVYVSQGGLLYRLQNGQFKELRPGPGAWSQPAFTPDGHLVVISRQTHFSDLYLLDPSGQAVRQLTKNSSGSVEFNHWAFYPSVSPDGRTLLYSYDPKDRLNVFRVDLAIYAMPLDGSQSDAKGRTTPNPYTGGDVQPIALASGAILYTKYSIDQDGHSVSQLWLQPRPGAAGEALTDSRDDCSSPAISRDGRRVAMVCTGAKQSGRVQIAPFDGQRLGPPQVLVEGLVAAPTWSPDGHSLLYVAPGGPEGRFQLWMIQLEAPPTPTPSGASTGAAKPSAKATSAPLPLRQPKLVTNDLDLDATSAPLWG